MAKSKNTFLKSKMNKDLDARIIANNEYKNAVNVQVNKSEGEHAGSLENVLGNTKTGDVAIFTGVSGLKCIGHTTDESNGIAYLFYTDWSDPYPSQITYNPNAKNFIIAFNSINNALAILVEGAFLNFSKTNPIYGVNVLENLLFWTDNRNQPRKINIKYATTIQNYYTTEDQISVAKYNPYKCIEMYAESKLSSTFSYETTMKDVSSIYLPNGGQGTTNAPITSGDTSFTLINFEGDIIQTNGSYGPSGAKISYIDVQGNVIEISGVTVDTATFDDTVNPNVWTINVTGQSALPSINNGTDIVLNANPYYDKGFAGDPNYLEDKFVRFGYRFKFDDDEYSLFSTFTQAAFIPKQDGYFMYVKNDDLGIEEINDENDAYQSTIVSWVENKVDDIKLRIPLPFKNYNLSNSLKVKSMDILYKESDQLPVKVVDTIDINEIFNSSAICNITTSTVSSTSVIVDNVRGGINVGDYVTGFDITTDVTVVSYTPDDPNVNPSTSGTILLSSAQTLTADTILTIGEPDYYIYDYQSKKPFKTLPEKDLIRVYDKIPVRAFAQEVSSNRVIYGNFQNKHSAPDYLDYNVAVTPKSEFNLNRDEGFVAGDYPAGTTVFTVQGLSRNQDLVPGMIILCEGLAEGTIIQSVAQNNFQAVITLSTPTVADIFNLQLIFFLPGGDTQNKTSIIEYPNHSVKTNRNYQIGVVLSDRYGRQSGVILSNNKKVITVNGNTYIGSTIYSPYNTLSTDPDDWPGNSIKISFNNQIANLRDIPNGYPGVYNGDPTSPNYNPLGWYTFKIVVKQTEQEYYNVYLPGIMASYPENQTLEIGKTSHAVLISDNINKIPKDLSEVGPIQNQFRSSVKLYGRVENSNVPVSVDQTNLGLSNLQYYPGNTFDFASTISTVRDLFNYNPQDPPDPNYFPQFYSIESNPFIVRINTAEKIGQVSNVNFTAVSASIAVSATTDTLQLANVSGPAGDIEAGDTVVGPGFPTDLVVVSYTSSSLSTTTTTTAAATSSVISVFNVFQITAGMIVTGVSGIPTGTIVLVVGAGGISTDLELSNVVSVFNNDTLIFSAPDQLVVSASVTVQVGDSINVYSATVPGIQYLAVYETEPVSSLLDIFWESSTTGVIQEINDIILNENEGGEGAEGFNGWNDDPFLEDLRPDAFGVYPSVLAAPIYLVDNFGQAIPSSNIDVPLSLDSVFDGNGVNVQTEYINPGFPPPFGQGGLPDPVFSFEETGVGTFEYDLKIASGFTNWIWYGTDENARTFTLNFSAVVNGLTTNIVKTLNLGNVAPHIKTGYPVALKCLRDQPSGGAGNTSIIYLYNDGSNAADVTIGWSVQTDSITNPFPSDLETIGAAYSPPGTAFPETGSPILNTPSDSNTIVVYSYNALYAAPYKIVKRKSSQGSGVIPDGTYVVSVQPNTPIANQSTITLSKNVTLSSNSLITFNSPGFLQVNDDVGIVEGQDISVINLNSLYDDCPLPTVYPGNTTTRIITNINAVNGAGFDPNKYDQGNINYGKDLTCIKTSEKNSAGIDTNYFDFESVVLQGIFPGQADQTVIRLINNGYEDSNMPSSVYTIDFTVTDPLDSINCSISVNTGVKVCEVQEWTLKGFYRQPGTNYSSGVAYEAKFTLVRVCNPPISPYWNPISCFFEYYQPENGWYAWMGGATDTGNFPNWNDLISSQGNNTIIIGDPVGCNAWLQAGQIYHLQDYEPYTTCGGTSYGFPGILTNIVNSGCVPDLVYGGAPGAWYWTLTGGSGTSNPLSPAVGNYLFSFA